MKSSSHDNVKLKGHFRLLTEPIVTEEPESFNN